MTGRRRAGAGGAHRGPLLAAFALVVGFMAVEVVAAIATGSLALLSDAGHMATDALGLGMALAAVVAASRPRREPGRTFGLYRLEILAALANALLLFAVSGYVLWESVSRIREPVDVGAGTMIVVGATGFAVNLAAWSILRRGSVRSLNVDGARLEVFADLLGSAGVIAAALLDRFAGWDRADPVFAAAIGLFIVPRAWRLGRRALRILVQAAPEGLDLDAVAARLARIGGVVDVHDLHVWTLTSDMEVASAHLVIADDAPSHPVLDEARAVLSSEHGIEHATFQIEPRSHAGCADVGW